MKPYVQDSDFTLFNGDALDVLRGLPDESVHMCVTSPPYWGLRSYLPDGHDDKSHEMGLEPTPEAYVARMVEVFREVRRVLRADGTCWVNLGDAYAHQSSGGGGAVDVRTDGRKTTPGDQVRGRVRGANTISGGLKPKDLCGVPWRLAFALQADGWYLRSDIIWSKPNPMPESVTDRPTKSHEYLFLLTRSPRYYYDAEAIREPHKEPWRGQGEAERNNWSVDGQRGSHETVRSYNPAGRNARSVWEIEQATLDPALPPETPRGPDGRRQTHVEAREGSLQHRSGERWPNEGRNTRSVWEIATQPYPDAHFATFPEELVRRCILAGTSERGCCPVCGKPWERETETSYEKGDARRGWPGSGGGGERGNPDGMKMTMPERKTKIVETLGWRPGCDCVCTVLETGEVDQPWTPIPCTVLDIFLGSGTTSFVARKHGRRSIGIELSSEYCALAARRLQQLSLLAEAEA